jgi:Rha family phage regulatory protein
MNNHKGKSKMSDLFSQTTIETKTDRQPVVFERGGEVFANSRDVAAFFGKEVKHIHEAIRNLTAKEPNWGIPNFRPNQINDLTGASISHYDMTRDGFALLAMGFTGAKALKFKLRYIAQFNAMEAKLKSAPHVDPMAVLNDPAAMRGLLLTYADKVLALEAKTAAMQPRVDALQRIADSDGSFCITDAAKTLQARPKDLFLFLRSNGWIYSRQGGAGELAYQSKLAAGVLEHKTTTVHRTDGSEKSVTQVRVTTKGLVRLAQEFPPALTLVRP